MGIIFEPYKETKGTVVYKATGDNPAIETIYIKKSGLSSLNLTGKENIVVDISKEVTK